MKSDIKPELDSCNLMPDRPSVHKKRQSSGGSLKATRVQTGVRISKRLLKVLKALAEVKDLTLEDLLESIVLHAFEGKTAFGKKSLTQIGDLKKIYGLPLHARDGHKLKAK